MYLVVEALPYLLSGLKYTIIMAIFSLFIGFVIGIILGIARFYGGRFSNAIALIYGRIIRSIPVIVMVMMLYLIIQSIIDLSPIACVIVALGLHSGAYQAEIIRGALGSVSKGEIMAAKTLGMTNKQVFINIIFPQIIINAIPGWTNEVAVVLKETSNGYVVGATEMLRQANYFASVNQKYLLMYMLAGLFYLILTYSSSKALGKLDLRFRHIE
jgi:polar amino acid transport system permease protein